MASHEYEAGTAGEFREPRDEGCHHLPRLTYVNVGAGPFQWDSV